MVDSNARGSYIFGLKTIQWMNGSNFFFPNVCVSRVDLKNKFKENFRESRNNDWLDVHLSNTSKSLMIFFTNVSSKL